jgi:hypothetical protein
MSKFLIGATPVVAINMQNAREGGPRLDYVRQV